MLIVTAAAEGDAELLLNGSKDMFRDSTFKLRMTGTEGGRS